MAARSRGHRVSFAVFPEVRSVARLKFSKTAPLAAVAPLRESAIVLAAAWGAIRLGEASSPRETALQIGAAVLVVLGALFLAIG